ncbi:hypothetical protein F5Y13DRAFT_186559 [Hypoxylon sp. FL1857]|nr:hypothetical protein F5Y13DRAFT_186559 [Hypoxylon sp. FL1857]
MNSPIASTSDSAFGSGYPTDDAWSIQCIPLPKSTIERNLDRCFHEIKDTINNMADAFLRLHLPAYQHVSASWDLQRVLVDAMGTIVKPHPFILAAQEGEVTDSLDRHIYAPVITITLPWNMLASDKRVSFLRDALLYDETYEFRGPHGIPLRQNTAYSQFTLEFRNTVVDLGGITGTLWCPSTTVYFPNPNTKFSGESMELVLHDTWNQMSIWDWAAQCMKARDVKVEKETPEVKDEDESMDDDAVIGLLEKELESLETEI